MDVKAAVDRLRQALGSRSDSELASAIGVPFQTLNSWKKRQSIPSSELISICQLHNISLDYVIFGNAPARRIAQSWEAAAFSIGVRMAMKSSGLDKAIQGELERSIASFTGWCLRLMEHEINDLGANVEETISKFESILERTPNQKSELAFGVIAIPLDGDSPE